MNAVAADRRYWNAELETMAPAELRRLEQGLLLEQIGYAGVASDLYRGSWAAASADPSRVRSLGDLSILPFTEKSDLQESQAARRPFGTNQAAPADRLVRMQATGGTSGRPLRMAMTRADVAVYNEVGARAAWAAGLRPGDILFECMNYSLYAGGVNDHGTFETLGACVAPVGVGQSKRLLEILADLGVPAALYSTPSYALHLAGVAIAEGRKPRELGLRRGLFSGDAGLANSAYRAEIEEVWGLIARNIYGTGETAPVAAECDAADGLHWLGQGAFLAEFVEPETGDPVESRDGATAELVITTLRREAHPLIRFRTHDYVRLMLEPCSCGRTGPRFTVLGRSDDMLIVRGINLFPLAVADVIDEFRPEVTGEFRILLDEPPPLVAPPRLRVEAGPTLEAARLPDLAARLGDRIREILMVSFAVELVEAGSLPRGEQKTRRVIRTWLGES